MRIIISFDDTDSLEGMCTTYLGAKVVWALMKRHRILDFPHLIRLNPNIPYKTRGNGAVVLYVSLSDSSDFEKVKNEVIAQVATLAMIQSEATHPGLLFIKGKPPKWMRQVAEKALAHVVTIKEVEQLLKKEKNVEYYKWKKGRGIVGACAAVGYSLLDYSRWTYELIGYRKPEMWGTKRQISRQSIINMDYKTMFTFTNYDYYNDVSLIDPHGKDPVLFGIRGTTPSYVTAVFRQLTFDEPLEMWMLYKTNQHTNIHYFNRTLRTNFSELKAFSQTILIGKVVKKFPEKKKGHLKFLISDMNGCHFPCLVYEPSKQFRWVIRQLIVGDYVKVGGAVKRTKEGELGLNVEFVEILSLAKSYEYHNPLCPHCGKRLKSLGHKKGFKCVKCRKKFFSLDKRITEIIRPLMEGYRYLVPQSALRHLSEYFDWNVWRLYRENTQVSEETTTIDAHAFLEKLLSSCVPNLHPKRSKIG